MELQEADKVLDSALADYCRIGNHVQYLSTIDNGVGSNQRTGSEVRYKWIHVKGVIEPIEFTKNHTVKFSIIYDAGGTGSVPNITDILTTDITWSSWNVSNRDRFFVLYDKTLPMQSYTATTEVVEPYNVDVLLDLQGIRAVYNKANTSGVVANIKSGALYAIFTGNVSGGTDLQGSYFDGGYNLCFTSNTEDIENKYPNELDGGFAYKEDINRSTAGGTKIIVPRDTQTDWWERFMTKSKLKYDAERRNRDYWQRQYDGWQQRLKDEL